MTSAILAVLTPAPAASASVIASCPDSAVQEGDDSGGVKMASTPGFLRFEVVALLARRLLAPVRDQLIGKPLPRFHAGGSEQPGHLVLQLCQDSPYGPDAQLALLNTGYDHAAIFQPKLPALPGRDTQPAVFRHADYLPIVAHGNFRLAPDNHNIAICKLKKMAKSCSGHQRP